MRFAFLLSITFGSCHAAVIKANANDPGKNMWLSFGRCPGMNSPVGITAQILPADPFLFLGMPSKPLDAKYTTADGKHLNEQARDTFFCNASIWMTAFKLLPAVKGRWIFQSSLSWNLCGSGYRVGPWKGDGTLYMKTLEALGPVGTTLFFGNIPSRFAMLPETCAGISMPVTTTSLTYFHFRKDAAGNKLAGGSYFMGALIAFKKKSPMLISIPVEEDADAGYVSAGYAVAVVCAIVSFLSSAIAAITIKKVGLRFTTSSFVLCYEGLAGVVRSVLLLLNAPFTYGPAFYNGIPWMTDIYLWSILTPLGLTTTIATSLVWLKFTLFRSKPPVAFDILLALVTLAATALSFWGALAYGLTNSNEGIIGAGVNAASVNALQVRLSISMTVTIISTLIFLVSNMLWVIKLSKLGAESKALAEVARKCMKIMFFQLLLLVGLLVSDAVNMAQINLVTAPVLDPDGVLTPNAPQIVGPFIQTPCESLSGAVQIFAIRTLSSSSSSSSSSSGEVGPDN